MEEASKRSRVCNLPHSLKLSSKCKKREKRDRDEDAKRAAATFPLLLSELSLLLLSGTRSIRFEIY